MYANFLIRFCGAYKYLERRIIMKEGLVTSLNAIRELAIADGKAYPQYVPIIDENTTIGEFGTPILNTPVVMNEFMSMLVNRIVYTSFETRYFNNPLQVLEGEAIPLGYAGQEIYVNPAKGRKYNVDDFAGLLAKYEADVKVQYTEVNMDLQYPVTVGRHKLKQAFTSWDALEGFINELSQSLYNGAYIGEYNNTKALISNAYAANNVQISIVDALSDVDKAKAFTESVRTTFLNMQTPTSDFNAWNKVGGYGNAVVTYSNPEDIVLVIRNDIRSFLDVNLLAMAFNIDKATLLGNIISVNNFDIYDDDGVKVYDGSNILGFIGDKRWFRIKRQDMYLDEFYNANNRTWQYYLNLTKMYNYSLFANGVVYATAIPEVDATKIEFTEDSLTIVEGEKATAILSIEPVNATEEVTFTSSDTNEDYIKIKKIDNKHVEITAVDATLAAQTITATCGNLTDTISVSVTAAS